MNPIAAAIRNRAAVYVIVAIVVITGSIAYRDMPRESSPDIPIPYVIVTTPYFGVSPEDIETLVTIPIENKLKNLGKLEEIRSTSVEGASIIVIEFTPEADIDEALQKVRDKVSLAEPDLPEDAEDPLIQEINLAEFPVLIANISGDVGLLRLKEIADRLKDRIEGVPGVLSVEVTGGLEREIRIEFDPERLSAYRLSHDDLVRAVHGANINLPAGNMIIGEADFLLRIPGEFADPREIMDLVVAQTGGQMVHVRDVARVVDGYKEPKTHSRLNGKDTVTLSVQKKTGENIIGVCDGVKDILGTWAHEQPAGLGATVAFDASKDIRRMVADLNNNIISGFILVVAVLFFFMGASNAFFVALAIPLSMLITFLVLHFSGITLNMIVLFSLILTVGMVVDNAIVIVENIFRHYHMGKSRFQASLLGASEVGVAVLTSTLTTVVAFIPMLFWPGIVGQFMWYLPITVVVSLAASFFVSVVVNPSLANRFMPRGSGKGLEVDEETGLTAHPSHYVNRYEALLRAALRRKWLTIGNSFALLAAIGVLYAFLGKGLQFFPDTDPTRATISINAPDGTSLDATDALAKSVECCLTDSPDLLNIITDTGAATDRFGGGMSTKSNRARISVEFTDRHLRKQSSRLTVEQIRRKFVDLVGAEIELQKEEHGPPAGKPVNIEVSGKEFAVLGELARKIRERIKDIPGLVDLKDDYERGRPEIRVLVDREKAALHGFSTYSAASAVRAAMNGIKAGTFREEKDEYDITVRLPLPLRDDVATLRNLVIAAPGGAQVPLSSIAGIDYGAGLGSIRRIDARRVITVESEVEGRLPATVLAEVKKAVAGIELPEDYTVAYTGEDKEQKQAQAFLSRAFLWAVLLVFLVIVPQFNSIAVPLIIMTSVILSLAGVLFGLVVTGTPFGIIMTGIGVITLAGVVVNNAIVLLDATMKNRQKGLSSLEAVVVAGKTRLRPVMLTAVTTILGLIPMATGVSFDFTAFAWEIGGESVQWWKPMAVAVIFGLTFATALTLVVVPALYMAFESIKLRLTGKPVFEEVTHEEN
jgi:CzcA family heavy metal efflux pump